MLISGGVTGIILAAGTGSRMGCAKQLLPFRSRTLLDAVIDNAKASRLQPIILVLGHDACRIRQTVDTAGLCVVTNDRYQQGQSTSLQAGLAAVPVDAAAVMFLLGDQPLVTTGIIDRLIAEYSRRQAPLVIPYFNGKRGNPVIVGRPLFDEIGQLKADTGARALFAAYADQIAKVPIDDSAVRLDIDTLQDYQRLISGTKGEKDG